MGPTHWLKKLIDLVLYSNLWIALAALSLALQTQLLLFGDLRWDPLFGFIFFATLCLYALHRLVGLSKVKPFREVGRFRIISRFQSHILIYAVVSGTGATWFFFLLPRQMQLASVLPSLISLGYVLPVLGNKRLRDLHYVKIFLIAIAWSWITVGLVAANRNWALTLPAMVILLERAMFVFAITLPFDIRDLQVDAFTQVETLPARLGIRRTKMLAAAILLGMLGCVAWSYRLDVYRFPQAVALAISALCSYLLIHFSDRVKHDYYFTGLIDGMMVGQFVLVLIASGWS